MHITFYVYWIRMRARTINEPHVLNNVARYYAQDALIASLMYFYHTTVLSRYSKA